MAEEFKLLSRTVTNHLCGFLERAKNHTGSFTHGRGTFCSTCHERIFNARFTGFGDVEGDMEIVARLRKKGTNIPVKIRKEISDFQNEVNWNPKWKW
jgi:hypothetical protein